MTPNLAAMSKPPACFCAWVRGGRGRTSEEGEEGGRKEGGREDGGVSYLAQPLQGFFVVGLHDARPWLRRKATRRGQAWLAAWAWGRVLNGKGRGDE